MAEINEFLTNEENIILEGGKKGRRRAKALAKVVKMGEALEQPNDRIKDLVAQARLQIDDEKLKEANRGLKKFIKSLRKSPVALLDGQEAVPDVTIPDVPDDKIEEPVTPVQEEAKSVDDAPETLAEETIAIQHESEPVIEDKNDQSAFSDRSINFLSGFVHPSRLATLNKEDIADITAKIIALRGQKRDAKLNHTLIVESYLNDMTYEEMAKVQSSTANSMQQAVSVIKKTLIKNGGADAFEALYTTAEPEEEIESPEPPEPEASAVPAVSEPDQPIKKFAPTPKDVVKEPLNHEQLESEPPYVKIAELWAEKLEFSSGHLAAFKSFLDPKSRGDMTEAKQEAVNKIRNYVQDAWGSIERVPDMTGPEIANVRMMLGLYKTQTGDQIRGAQPMLDLLNAKRQTPIKRKETEQAVYSAFEKLLASPEQTDSFAAVYESLIEATKNPEISREAFLELSEAVKSRYLEKGVMAVEEVEATWARVLRDSDHEGSGTLVDFKSAVKTLQRLRVDTEGRVKLDDEVRRRFKYFVQPGGTGSERWIREHLVGTGDENMVERQLVLALGSLIK